VSRPLIAMNLSFSPVPVLAASDGWISVGIFLALIAVIIALGVVYDRKRQKALADTAASLGLRFVPKADTAFMEAFRAEFAQFPLSQQGRGNQISGGVVEGSLGGGGIGIRIFDHQYTTGSGKSSHTHTSTVVALHLPEISLPAFVLKEEGVHFSFFGLFKKPEDINFEGWPLFSDKFHLTGDDEAAVRQLFKPRVLEWFEQRLRLRVECAGDTLIVYRLGKRVKPALIADSVKEAGELAAVLIAARA